MARNVSYMLNLYHTKETPLFAQNDYREESNSDYIAPSESEEDCDVSGESDFEESDDERLENEERDCNLFARRHVYSKMGNWDASCVDKDEFALKMWDETPEGMDIGVCFKSQSETKHAVKLWNIHHKREYTVAASSPRTWAVRCRTFNVESEDGEPPYVPYKRAWHGRRKAIEAVYGDWTSNFEELPRYIAALKFTNPETVVEWEWKEGQEGWNRGNRTFKYVFWSFAPVAETFFECPPVICINGTFLRGGYEGKLLVAVVYTANKHILPVIFVIVDEETVESWTFFMRNLRLWIVYDRIVSVISDRNAWLLSAMSQMDEWRDLGDGGHFLCLRHVRSNLVSRYNRKKVKRLCWKMGTTLSRVKYNRMRAELIEFKPAAWEYLRGIGGSNWARLKAGLRRWGIATTNIFESYNNALKGIRFLPIRALIDATFRKTVKFYREEQLSARNCMTPIPPELWKKYEKMNDKAASFEATPFDGDDAMWRVFTATRLSGRGGSLHMVNYDEHRIEMATPASGSQYDYQPKHLHPGPIQDKMLYRQTKHRSQAVYENKIPDIKTFSPQGMWECRYTYGDAPRSSTPPFRDQLISLRVEDFRWQLYAHVLHRLPDFCTQGHESGRVVRQFGCIKDVPKRPMIKDNAAFLLDHAHSMSGYPSNNWVDHHSAVRRHWNRREEFVLRDLEEVDPGSVYEGYYKWFMVNTVRLISNPDNYEPQGYETSLSRVKLYGEVLNNIRVSTERFREKREDDNLLDEELDKHLDDIINQTHAALTLGANDEMEVEDTQILVDEDPFLPSQPPPGKKAKPWSRDKIGGGRKRKVETHFEEAGGPETQFDLGGPETQFDLGGPETQFGGQSQPQPGVKFITMGESQSQPQIETQFGGQSQPQQSSILKYLKRGDRILQGPNKYTPDAHNKGKGKK
ncbi:OLC1v1012455C1 [Oldenlandia corymbosa var. corymbosa]|uniref:OLC1v1012455C1 n=1 Tax=Oldenlandia corymbosa var. corymbosa TaxID=529605 RepID=A0AAV1DZH6_OLDCO|nr:OLC1v1012455C1 [Oldenlandia corymbosa var. corymbosa]